MSNTYRFGLRIVPMIIPQVRIKRRPLKHESPLKRMMYIDGRSLEAKRFKQIVRAIEVDLGGDLTETQKLLLGCIASTAILKERADAAILNNKALDIGEYTSLVSALRKLLETAGLRRIAKGINEIDLRAYLSAPQSPVGARNGARAPEMGATP
jgi:hypothetical protein